MIRPIVGRDIELRECLALVECGAPGVGIVGERGVGKTRLMEELAARVEATQPRSVVFADEWARAGPPAERTAAGLWQAQKDLVGPNPHDAVVFVDDVHRLDDLWLAALDLANRVAAATIVVATSPARASQPGVMNLWKDNGLNRIALRPLSEHHAAELVRQLTPRAPTAAELREAWRLTQGYPAELIDLILGAVEAGHLEGHPPGAPLGPLAQNPRMRRRVAERMDGLSERARTAYEVLALGEDAPTEDLEIYAGSEALLELESRSLVRVEQRRQPAHVRPSSALEAETVASTLDDRRRAAACRTLLDRHADRPIRSRPELIRRAEWQLASGRPIDDRLLLDAAWAALLTHGTTRARRLAAATGDSAERDSVVTQIGWLEGARTIITGGRPTRAAGAAPGQLEGLGEQLLDGFLGGDPGKAITLAEAAEALTSNDLTARAGPAALALCTQSWAWWAMGRMGEHLARMDRWAGEYSGIRTQIDAARAGSLLMSESNDATPWLAQTLEDLLINDPLGQLPWLLSATIEANLRRGRIDEATSALRHLERMEPLWPLLAVEQERARGIYALYTGPRTSGGEHLARALEMAFAFRKPALEARVLEDRLRFGWLDEADRGLRTILLDLAKPWPQLQALAKFAAAAAIDDVSGLHQASVELLRGGWTLLAAEAAARASGAAVALGGQVARAHGLAMRSLLISARFPQVRTPALAMRVLIISEREAEIARLAARGVSSRTIAEKRQLASRTVENHLASTYRKLDIHGRDDLREIYSQTLSDLPDAPAGNLLGDPERPGPGG